ncbi:MAG: dihydrofolate reductase [Bacteroidetes bacterium]|nr:MAG: dihydrofolate reductase [Bacteroidota bacterium]
MRKLIAGMNMTLDGICDHTAMIADDEIHEHYNQLLLNSDDLIYGRITYQLMESYWPTVVNSPTGNKPIDDFAIIIDNISKLVFSHTMNGVTWKNSRLATGSIKDEVTDLKNQPGKDILVGSPSLIVATANLGLVDEFQIMIQPTIQGKGLQLFKNIQDRINLRLIKTKTFACGAVIFYYETVRK